VKQRLAGVERIEVGDDDDDVAVVRQSPSIAESCPDRRTANRRFSYWKRGVIGCRIRLILVTFTMLPGRSQSHTLKSYFSGKLSTSSPHPPTTLSRCKFLYTRRLWRLVKSTGVGKQWPPYRFASITGK